MLVLAWIWIALLLVATVGGAYTDVSDKKPGWFVSAGLLSGTLCALFVGLYFGLVHYVGSGTLLITLTLGAAAWAVYAGIVDARNVQREGASRFELGIAIGAVTVLYLPAVVVGLVHGWRLYNNDF